MGKVSDLVDQGKAWWESKTIIAAIMTALVTIAGLFGYDIGDLVNVTFTEADSVAQEVDKIWVAIELAIGTVVTAWMRIKAAVKIK